MCFVWISEQTTIISLHSINLLVFITETVGAYCAVRTESLYIIKIFCVFKGLECLIRVSSTDDVRVSYGEKRTHLYTGKEYFP